VKPDDAVTDRRVCALLFRRVGDSLLATPALRALKKGVADCRLQVYAEPQVMRVFQHNPWVDDLIEVDEPNAFRLASLVRQGRKPGVTVDFLSDPRSAWASFLSRAPVRVGFAHSVRRHLYTHLAPLQDPTQPIYSARHKLRLANALGCDEQDTRTEFHLSQQDRDFADTIWRERQWSGVPVAAFFIHSRRDYKRWPLKFFAEVIEHLTRQNHLLPLVLSTPEDESAAGTLSTLAHLEDSQILELRDLGHLGAVLAKCALLIGNDGGPKHLAVAVGTPTVTIFRDESPDYWTPPNTNFHMAVSAPPLGSVYDVPPSAVIGVVESLLAVTAS
jgi:ADP-heptose:LPS heptosyltransferase